MPAADAFLARPTRAATPRVARSRTLVVRNMNIALDGELVAAAQQFDLYDGRSEPDRVLASDITRIRELTEDGSLLDAATAVLGRKD